MRNRAVSSGSSGPESESPRFTTCVTARRRVSASTASSAGRLPWMSETSAMRTGISGKYGVPARLGERIRLTGAAHRRAARQAVTDGRPLLLTGHILHQDLLATRLVQRAQIGIQIVRVGVRP